MNKKIAIPIGILAVLLAAGGLAYASARSKNSCGKNIQYQGILAHRTVPELAKEADSVVIGTVKDILPSSCLTEKTGEKRIYTDYILNVEQGLKGSASRDITIRLPGGTIGSGPGKITMWTEDTPEFKKGEVALVFLSKDSLTNMPDGYYSVYGATLGKYTVKDGKATNPTGTLAIGELINQILSPDQPAGPTPEKMESEKAAIRKFMNDPGLELNFITTNKNPDNFSVGTTTLLGEGAWKMDIPDAWKRPTDIYQQTKYIDDRCEVYEYEIDSRNNHIIEVHVRYPETLQQINKEQIAAKCGQLGSIEAPLQTKAQIERAAFEYIGRDNADILLRSNIQLAYTPSTKSPKNIAATHEWKWQDKSYRLPEGLTAEEDPYPTVRIIMTSAGKLLYYFNSRGLFQ